MSIDSFGGLSDRQLAFEQGLNVVCGRNETGKSTVFHAVQKGLFTSTDLTKPQFKREIERFLPPGGDTVRIEISFERMGQEYRIRRAWGGGKEVELRGPDGAVVSDEKEIRKTLDELLPAKPGTFNSILMTYQSGLPHTISELKSEHSETMMTLGDILRRAFLETDGVPVERLRHRLREDLEGYYSHWDREQKGPERGRDLNNPWEKKVGHILSSYYNKESGRIAYEEAVRYEEELDRVVEHIAALTKELEDTRSFVGEHMKAADDVKERGRLQEEQEACQGSLDALTKANTDWPVSESRLKELEPRIAEMEKEASRLAREHERAVAEEKQSGLRKRHQRALEKKIALKEIQKKFETTTQLTREECEKLSEAFRERQAAGTKIDAGKFSLNIKARKNMEIDVRRDLEEGEKKVIADGEALVVEAGAFLEIAHPDWEMEISSGEGDVKALTEAFREAESRFRALLSKHGVESVEGAGRVNEEYEKIARERERAREFLESELDGETFEDLEAKVKALGTETWQRPAVDVMDELFKVKEKLTSARGDGEGLRKKVDGFKDLYGDTTRLLVRVAGVTMKQKELSEKIEALAQLPAGYEDEESFLREYDEKALKIRMIESDLGERKIEKAEHDGRAPEESAEVLKKHLEDLEEEFERVERKAQVIARIQGRAEQILEEMDSGSTSLMKEGIEKYMAAMTASRYTSISMEEGLPTGLVRGDGQRLECGLLSAGTIDVLSLALRLSMADHFLGEADGFLMMDDPLVDLDPERQLMTADVLRRFAEKRQLIIFTCHPGHAETLGGHRITLDVEER